MSNIDSLHNRGSALENQFFANLDAKLLAELKSRQDLDNAIVEFSRISGIKDTKILAAVHNLGVTPQAFSALRVFPIGSGGLGRRNARGSRKIDDQYVSLNAFSKAVPSQPIAGKVARDEADVGDV